MTEGPSLLSTWGNDPGVSFHSLAALSSNPPARYVSHGDIEAEHSLVYMGKDIKHFISVYFNNIYRTEHDYVTYMIIKMLL